jgi:hypothetical protein
MFSSIRQLYFFSLIASYRNNIDTKIITVYFVHFRNPQSIIFYTFLRSFFRYHVRKCHSLFWILINKTTTH